MVVSAFWFFESKLPGATTRQADFFLGATESGIVVGAGGYFDTGFAFSAIAIGERKTLELSFSLASSFFLLLFSAGGNLRGNPSIILL